MSITGKQIYRVVLDSSDKLSGTWNDGVFTVNKSSKSSVDSYPCLLQQIPQGRSYMA